MKNSKFTEEQIAYALPGALGMAAHLIGDRNNLVRISPTVGEAFTLDNAREIRLAETIGRL